MDGSSKLCKKLHMPSDADTKLQKDTLVEFDLHDCCIDIFS